MRGKQDRTFSDSLAHGKEMGFGGLLGQVFNCEFPMLYVVIPDHAASV